MAIVGSRVFVNPRGLLRAQRIIAAEVGDMYWTGFISGGAPGVDAECERYCQEMDRPCGIFLPQNQRWRPGGYEERNKLIAENCDELLCIRCAQSKSYGSGWTADYAEKLGKPVTRILIG